MGKAIRYGWMVWLLLGSGAFASPTERAYQPIILKGASFPNFLGAPTSELFLMAYQRDMTTWSPIPFQIDNLTTDGSYFGATNDTLDAQDELVFLTQDLGDSATVADWHEPAGHYIRSRYRIVVRDTAAAGADTLGFAYLCRGPVPLAMLAGYMTVDSLHDRVLSHYYQMGFITDSGLPNSVRILQANAGDSLNFLDRLKIRLQIKIYSQPILVTEDAVHKVSAPQYLSGPVRVIRNVPFHIVIDLGSTGELVLKDTFNIELQFFPYSMLVSIPGLDLSPIQQYGSVDWLRFTFDYNGAAAIPPGMKLINPGNELTINGQMDATEQNIDKSLTVPGLNWILAAGNHGSVLVMTSVPALGDQQEFYYKDDNHYDAEDTGDHVSFGDSGFLLTGNITTGSFDFLSTAYFLPANFTKAAAESLFAQQRSPLQYNFFFQEDTTAVEQPSSPTPTSYSLIQVYPNPYFISDNGGVQIQLRLAQRENLRLVLFNLLGQQIAELPPRAIPAGEHQLFWQLTKDHLAAGVYWLVARSDKLQLTQKILILP